MPRRMLARLGLSIFFTLNVMVFTMALWTQDVYQGTDDAGGPFLRSTPSTAWNELLRYACLAFSAPVLILLGGPLLESAWQDVRNRRLTIEPLIVAGVLAAFAYSVVSLVQEERHVYFEVGCAVLVAVTLGRWLEATGKLQTMQALRSLERLLPATARRVGHSASDPRGDDRWHEIPSSEVQVGDLIRVFPGERICVDGTLERHPAAIDQQLITGESEPVLKEPGASVHAGSLNLDGDLWVRVTAPLNAGTLQRLIAAVQAAASSRGTDQRLADRITGWFIPGVMLVAFGSLAWHASRYGLADGLLSALAVVLIACPCALGIATPLAIWGALARGARNQVLFRDGDALSRLARVGVVCFDKTGTLTTGKAEVTDFWVDTRLSRRGVLDLAAALASASPHSLSLAIQDFAAGECPWKEPAGTRQSAEPPRAPGRVTTRPGRGLVCDYDGSVAGLGSPRLMDELGFCWPTDLREPIRVAVAAGSPMACVGWQHAVQGVFVFREELRSEARPCIETLHQRGLETRLLTGDSSRRGERVGAELGLVVHAGLLPENKQVLVGQLRRGKRCVAMVGDGINDAPALAAADVGVALGCGADVSREVAHVCLLGNDLSRLPWAIDLAHDTVRTIRQNLFWAFLYNVLGIGLAAVGWLNPVFAAAAMVGSSIIVTANSLRPARVDHGSNQQPEVSASTTRPASVGLRSPAENAFVGAGS